jgi:hypothetical protein
VFVWLRDSLNRGETIAAEKNLGRMTKVISGWTDEGGGCEEPIRTYGPPPFCKRKMRMTE